MPRTEKATASVSPESIVVGGVTYVREDIAAARSAAASEASLHYTERDLPCTADKPCTKTFRTAKGVDWHVANVKHA